MPSPSRLTRIAVAFAVTYVLSSCEAADVSDYEITSLQTTSWVSDPTTPTETWLVRAHGAHRIRIERTCGKEHCRTLAFLESLSAEFPRSVTRAAEIAEIAKRADAFVQDVEVVELKGSYAFDLKSTDPYGGLSGFTMRIRPSGDVEYRVDFVEEWFH